MDFVDKVYTAEAVRAIESRCRDASGTCYGLMQKAGQALADRIRQELAGGGRRVVFFCGAGNNGGDGYEAAAILRCRGVETIVCEYRKPKDGTEAARAYALCLDAGIRTVSDLSSLDIAEGDILVDALLGIGVRGEVSQPMLSWISFINRFSGRCFILAVDTPSGLDADSGYCSPDAVRADVTLTLLRPKAGLFTGLAGDYAGRIEFNDLGVEADSADAGCYFRYSYDSPELRRLLPRRKNSCNKSDSGRLLLAGGAPGMPGALKMAAMAALRSGAGLVRVAASARSLPLIFAGTPELMLLPLEEKSPEEIFQAIMWSNALVIGPGLGRTEHSREVYRSFIDAPRPMVVDADALYFLAQDMRRLEHAVVTPHEMEAARLLGCDVEYVRRNRYNVVFRLHELTGAVVVLKGPGTVICDGSSCHVSADGSSALAVGGSGDVLSGIIGALLAFGLSCSDAARVAVAIHGRAGMLASLDGSIGTLPTDLLCNIRKLINAKIHDLQFKEITQ
ncbi:MAG: NAD(P)H-hydrate dehydratase [Succinivibrionaceae bacterium]|nr:NAD(P)H-hydrate dehydratase [Succinivibrionaceae bacterium]